MESSGSDGSDSNGGSKSMTKKHIVRSHFPETWLFQLRPVDRHGKADVSMKAPDTLTSWTAEAVCMSSTAGIGLAQPARILVKKDFFADLRLPYSVKRGEVFPLNVTLFNYLDEKLPLVVSVKAKADHLKVSNPTQRVCLDPMGSY